MPIDWEQAIEIAKSVAREAGAMLLSRSDWAVSHASQRDVKLDADLIAERIIIERLQNVCPVLSEEAGGQISASGPTWIVDPLDGTVNFLREIPLSAISIALWDDGPVAGVVYDFRRDEMFCGIVGAGCSLNGVAASVSDVSDLGAAIALTGFPVAHSFDQAPLLRFVEDLQRYRKVRLLGSAALSLAYVAAGRADAYMENSIRIWDVAAGLALVRAAGGEIVIRGDDPCDVVAHNGALALPH